MKTPWQVWQHLIRILGEDNGGSFIVDTSDYMRAKSAIEDLLAEGFFQDNPYNLDSDYWIAAAGEQSEAMAHFWPLSFCTLSDVLNEVFERP